MRAWEDADVQTSTDSYARRFEGSVGEWFLDVQARQTLSLLRSPGEQLRVLEVGGGHAQLVPHLVSEGHAVTVLGSRQACGKRLLRWTASGQCAFEVGNPADLPYPDQAFDVVLGFRLLPHVKDWQRFISELCRVARCSVLVDYPSARSVNAVSAPLFWLKQYIEKDTRPFRLFSPRAVRHAFEGEGFRIGATRPQFLLPMALYRAIGSARIAHALEQPGRLLGLTRMLGSPVIARADRQS